MKSMLIRAAFAAFLLCAIPAGNAWAQALGMAPCASFPVTAGTTSTATAFQNCGQIAQLTNIGSTEAFYAIGTSSVVATLPSGGVDKTSFPIEPGQTLALQVGFGVQYIAAITASGTDTLRVTQGAGIGYFSGFGGTGGGSGGSTTITGPLGPSTTAAQSVATTFGAGTLLPAFAATPSFNESQINGATVPAGPGPSTSNTQRVTLSSDSPAPPAQKYTLVSGSNTTGTYTQAAIAGGAYALNINATTFNGTNVALTYSQDGFSTTTTNYTSNTITAQSVINVYQGTSVTAVVTGGPPTGLTVSLAGGPAAGGGTQLVANANPANLYSNQQTTTTSAVALPSQALVNGISIIALSTNTGTVYVGGSGVTPSNGYPLAPGQGSPGIAVQNLSAIYILGTNTTDKVAFVGN